MFPLPQRWRLAREHSWRVCKKMSKWIETTALDEAPLFSRRAVGLSTLSISIQVACGIMLAAKSDITDEVFNVASGVETSPKELAHALLKVMGADLQPQYREERKVNAVPRRLADLDKAKEALGFNAIVPLEEGLGELVAWWCARRDLARAA